ncbi:hypothetical protein DL89DRAFT_267928 [Linderina pennispora]|uniref:sn-1-specific diacylglycerol lipase n=1 Tax=Linderina pennispora TaxID=61395 RepID=A0A1Y1W948_9FUNG|nr:uncharacterized protein DL89DRAFT_267928 [Linderina pennispora]ORX69776.1 hypothetical protein DL89DRAFT_267928 [Linderina pennispora]
MEFVPNTSPIQPLVASDFSLDGLDDRAGKRQRRHALKSARFASKLRATDNGSDKHAWRQRPPILPQRVASLVSAMSGATRLSLEITTLFWEAVFETIAESTSSGLWLGSAAWEEAKAITMACTSILSPLAALNPRIVQRLFESSTHAGATLLNSSWRRSKAVNMGMHAMGESVRLFDAVFGATDTSSVLRSFVHLCYREAIDKNPEIRAMYRNLGLVGFVSHLVYANTISQPPFCNRDTEDMSVDGKANSVRTPQMHANVTVQAEDGQPTMPRRVSVFDSEDDHDVYFAMSDQESSRRDPEWDQRLMEALRSLSIRIDGSGANTGDDNIHGAREEATNARSDGSPVHPAFESAPASLISSPTGIQAIPVRQMHSTAPFIAPTSPMSLLQVPEVATFDHESQWLQQEFPRKPLLFNLARFVTVASSAYGRRFMQVLGIAHTSVDVRALIDRFGDYEVSTMPSRSPSIVTTPGHVERIPSMSKLPRAQPMSTYHTHSAYNPSRPDSQRQYERRHFRQSGHSSPHGRRALGRRPVRRRSNRRRPVTDHPNHFCFAQHTGIPLRDLLFSSYAANAHAEAVERRLRSRQSANQLRRERSRQADAPQTTDQSSAPAEPSDAPTSWVSSIPIVGSLMVSRMFTKPTVIEVSKNTPPLPDHQNEPTLKQFRRFDKIRQRLVYRNPSIHALVHYIAVDHATRAVVLACRGTLGISDLFIDMICEYETVHLPDHPATTGENGYRVHSGMWHSALLLADPSSEVFREVAEALRLYPEYGLVITGHSLGGGVASLLTLLWSQPLFTHSQDQAMATPGSTMGGMRQFATSDTFGLVSTRPIHCFSFGSPYLLNISAVLGRERGVAEKVVRRFLNEQRKKIGGKLRWFDFDFSRLRAYASSDDEDDDAADEELAEEGEEIGAEESASVFGGYWWSRKSTSARTSSDTASTASSSASSTSSAKRQKSDPKSRKQRLDDWYWSLIKTLRASMDSEKLYPPGDVFVLASPGEEDRADKLFPNLERRPKGDEHPESLPTALFYCPDVTERFSELRFSRNMIKHHLPSTYEKEDSCSCP